MTHIPFKHSMVKGGSMAASSACPASATSRGSCTLSYSNSSSAGSTESFPSDTSCGDSESVIGSSPDDLDYIPTDDGFATEVPPHTGKKTVLVTGAAGFIGSWVADTLLARGDDVVIVDEVNSYYDVRTKRSNIAMLLEKYGPNRVKFFEGDLCDAPFITRIFETEGVEWVVHMAARAGVRPSIEDPFVYVHSNVEATTRLLELSRLHGVKSFVFASSSSVYGGSQKEVFSEKDVVDFPVSPYAATKKSCELMAHTYSHLYGLNIAGLRFFTVYGPRGRPDMAPYKFIDLVARGQEIMQFGDGSTSRDYTYISDIVDGVVRSLDRPAGYQIYNLGNGSPVSLSSFIKLVEKSVGTPAKIRVCPEQPGDVPRTCADISKARAMLGYNPSVAFADGIGKTVDWYQNRAAMNAAPGVGVGAVVDDADDVIAEEEPLTVELLSLCTTQAAAGRARSVSCASASALDMDFCDSILPKAMMSQRQQQLLAAAADGGVALERVSRTTSYAY
ncbi:unnamed protein product [Ectocarpus sp. CCAP 1310/34]|nr:unnamed protein product [Ectocarpus sp. CCAP 1310/34]